MPCWIRGWSPRAEDEVELIPAQELARIWDAEHVSPPESPLVDHAEVVRRLEAFVKRSPDLFSMERIGESIEGRSITAGEVES